MLRTLKELDPREAERVLADAVQSLLPQPHSVALQKVDPPVNRLLQELSEQIGVQLNDVSPSSRARLLEELVHHLSAPILTGPRRLRAKRRLGERGDLRPDQYQVRFQPDFAVCEARGIRRRHVENAIHQPDAIEHLPSVIPEEEKGISFFVKSVTESATSFLLLVQALRDGDALDVLTALRIYSSDVDLTSAATPLEVYQRFMERYGIEFTIGALGPAKYRLNEFIHYVGGGLPPEIETIDQSNRTLEGRVLWRLSRVMGTAYVVTAYVINAQPYLDDLKRHGVLVSPEYFEIAKRFDHSSGHTL
jgi:hypothetical protein